MENINQKIISYGKQTIGDDDIDSALRVLQSDWLTQGPAIKIFENHLNDYFGSNFACAVSNGTAALHLAGLALGWGNEDIIITTPLTFIATANSIVYNGASPDFVDICKSTYTIDPNLLEKKVKAYRSRGINVKAVIGVDYAGHPCDWEALSDIAHRYELQIINDNCHALGASYQGDKQYAVKYADLVTQSYHPVKHITTGEGGAILTNNIDFYDKINSLRTHGMIKDPDKLNNNDGPWFYEMQELGYNYRLTDFQCALGSSQLKKLDLFNIKREKIAKTYDSLLSDINFLKLPNVDKNVKHSYHLYPIQIDFKKCPISKKQFFERMKNSGILLQVHYIPVHLQPYYKRNFGFKEGDYPNSENFYKNEISLPIYPSLTKEDQLKVVEETKAILNG